MNFTDEGNIIFLIVFKETLLMSKLARGYLLQWARTKKITVKFEKAPKVYS